MLQEENNQRRHPKSFNSLQENVSTEIFDLGGCTKLMYQQNRVSCNSKTTKET